jgi:pimeloyl-ACP methyl ester carboxylesterase
MARDAPPRDESYLASGGRELLLAGAKDAMAQGTEGWVIEARVVREPWPFGPADIGCRVLLRHGTHDAAVPVQSAIDWAAALPNAELQVDPDAGHLGCLLDLDALATRLVAQRRPGVEADRRARPVRRGRARRGMGR